MKNNLLLSLAAIVVFASGCLKDKGFDNQDFGIAPTEVRGIGFIGFDRDADGLIRIVKVAEAQAEPQNLGTVVGLFANNRASADISYTVVADQALVPASVVIGGTTKAVTVLDPSEFTIGSGMISSGDWNDTLNITILDASGLSTSALYGVYLRITASGDNLKIAEESRQELVLFSIKNRYDGEYRLDWTNYHPTNNPGYTGSSTTVHMITSGPNSVKIFWPLAGVYANPAILNGNLNYFGSQEPEYTIDAATGQVTVQNSFPGAVTFYTMNPSYNSHWEAGPPQEIFAKWGYSYVGGVFTLGTSREWTQHFTYIRPRP